jgi:hypothetical protein
MEKRNNVKVRLHMTFKVTFAVITEKFLASSKVTTDINGNQT